MRLDGDTGETGETETVKGEIERLKTRVASTTRNISFSSKL